MLPAAHLRKVVDWARERGAVVASDECYLSLGWDETPVSVLADEVCGGDYTGVLAVHSLSKRSNLAGYRAGFVGGDPALIAELLAVRKHAGMIVPAPVQAAMIAALGDEAHVAEQRARYAARRDDAAGGAAQGRLRRSSTRGRPLPVGDPRRGLLADRRLARRARHPGRSGRLLRPGRGPARPRRPDRHRRAGRRRGQSLGGLTAAAGDAYR